MRLPLTALRCAPARPSFFSQVASFEADVGAFHALRHAAAAALAELDSLGESKAVAGHRAPRDERAR